MQLVNDAGKAIPGVMTYNPEIWKPTAQLGYGRTYTLTIAARGPGGMPTRQTSSFTTLTPGNQTKVYLRDHRGWPAAGRRDLRRRAGASSRSSTNPSTTRPTPRGHLVVAAKPPVAGTWNWIDNQTAHWQPEAPRQDKAA